MTTTDPKQIMIHPIRAALERLLCVLEPFDPYPLALGDAIVAGHAALAAADDDPDPANGESLPPAMLTEEELASSWNQQADEFNRWDSLDSGEHLAWAQARAVARDRAARLPDSAAGGEALLAAPAAEGEVRESAAWLRSDADINESYGLTESAAFQRRAAALLECLEQVAYAASDFICGTRFPEFANEHGGLDRLMADLCRLVAQFEHGPRPVPGVDVPGPDGDWGGLAELCNAEGVDPRIGVPLLQRAREAWKYASQTAPAAPADGEVGQLVAWLLQRCQLMSEAPGSEFHLFTRAAALLQQQAAELAALRAPQGGEVE